MTTIVQCKVTSIKRQDYGEKIQTVIELNVPYGKDNVFYQQSGGTFMNLVTVNEEAAKMFEIGQSYEISISPAPQINS